MRILYVIGQDAGPFKVGVTSNVQRRMSSIQTGCPFPLKLMYSLETEAAELREKEVHANLSPFRTSGEWFDAPIDLIIDTVNGRCQIEPSGNAPLIERWVFDMRKAGLARNEEDCASLLGVTLSTLLHYKKNGADQTIALACRALLHRMEPYGSMDG